MNLAESNYWDTKALLTVDPEKNVVIYDNVNKRRAIVKRLMDFDFFRTAVLEIGIGNGTIAQCIRSIFHNLVNYQATDVSPVFCSFCSKRYGIDVKQADVTALPYPDRSFDYVFAFDSLEHVRPADRMQGYQEIGRVMKKDSCVILNIPMNDSQHDKEFDHGFTYKDFMQLLDVTGCRLAQYNVFTVVNKHHTPSSILQYAFAIGERHP